MSIGSPSRVAVGVVAACDEWAREGKRYRVDFLNGILDVGGTGWGDEDGKGDPEEDTPGVRAKRKRLTSAGRPLQTARLGGSGSSYRGRTAPSSTSDVLSRNAARVPTAEPKYTRIGVRQDAKVRTNESDSEDFGEDFDEEMVRGIEGIEKATGTGSDTDPGDYAFSIGPLRTGPVRVRIQQVAKVQDMTRGHDLLNTPVHEPRAWAEAARRQGEKEGVGDLVETSACYCAAVAAIAAQLSLHMPSPPPTSSRVQHQFPGGWKAALAAGGAMSVPAGAPTVPARSVFGSTGPSPGALTGLPRRRSARSRRVSGEAGIAASAPDSVSDEDGEREYGTGDAVGGVDGDNDGEYVFMGRGNRGGTGRGRGRPRGRPRSTPSALQPRDRVNVGAIFWGQSVEARESRPDRTQNNARGPGRSRHISPEVVPSASEDGEEVDELADAFADEVQRVANNVAAPVAENESTQTVKPNSEALASEAASSLQPEPQSATKPMALKTSSAATNAAAPLASSSHAPNPTTTTTIATARAARLAARRRASAVSGAFSNSNSFSSFHFPAGSDSGLEGSDDDGTLGDKDKATVELSNLADEEMEKAAGDGGGRGVHGIVREEMREVGGAGGRLRASKRRLVPRRRAILAAIDSSSAREPVPHSVPSVAVVDEAVSGIATLNNECELSTSSALFVESRPFTPVQDDEGFPSRPRSPLSPPSPSYIHVEPMSPLPNVESQSSPQSQSPPLPPAAASLAVFQEIAHMQQPSLWDIATDLAPPPPVRPRPPSPASAKRHKVALRAAKFVGALPDEVGSVPPGWGPELEEGGMERAGVVVDTISEPWKDEKWREEAWRDVRCSEGEPPAEAFSERMVWRGEGGKVRESVGNNEQVVDDVEKEGQVSRLNGDIDIDSVLEDHMTIPQLSVNDAVTLDDPEFGIGIEPDTQVDWDLLSVAAAFEEIVAVAAELSAKGLRIDEDGSLVREGERASWYQDDEEEDPPPLDDTGVPTHAGFAEIAPAYVPSGVVDDGLDAGGVQEDHFTSEDDDGNDKVHPLHFDDEQEDEHGDGELELLEVGHLNIDHPPNVITGLGEAISLSGEEHVSRAYEMEFERSKREVEEMVEVAERLSAKMRTTLETLDERIRVADQSTYDQLAKEDERWGQKARNKQRNTERTGGCICGLSPKEVKPGKLPKTMVDCQNFDLGNGVTGLLEYDPRAREIDEPPPRIVPLVAPLPPPPKFLQQAARLVPSLDKPSTGRPLGRPPKSLKGIVPRKAGTIGPGVLVGRREAAPAAPSARELRRLRRKTMESDDIVREPVAVDPVPSEPPTETPVNDSRLRMRRATTRGAPTNLEKTPVRQLPARRAATMNGGITSRLTQDEGVRAEQSIPDGRPSPGKRLKRLTIRINTSLITRSPLDTVNNQTEGNTIFVASNDDPRVPVAGGGVCMSPSTMESGQVGDVFDSVLSDVSRVATGDMEADREVVGMNVGELARGEPANIFEEGAIAIKGDLGSTADCDMDIADVTPVIPVRMDADEQSPPSTLHDTPPYSAATAPCDDASPLTRDSSQLLTAAVTITPARSASRRSSNTQTAVGDSDQGAGAPTAPRKWSSDTSGSLRVELEPWPSVSKSLKITFKPALAMSGAIEKHPPTRKVDAQSQQSVPTKGGKGNLVITSAVARQASGDVERSLSLPIKNTLAEKNMIGGAVYSAKLRGSVREDLSGESSRDKILAPAPSQKVRGKSWKDRESTNDFVILPHELSSNGLKTYSLNRNSPRHNGLSSSTLPRRKTIIPVSDRATRAQSAALSKEIIDQGDADDESDGMGKVRSGVKVAKIGRIRGATSGEGSGGLFKEKVGPRSGLRGNPSGIVKLNREAVCSSRQRPAAVALSTASYTEDDGTEPSEDDSGSNSFVSVSGGLRYSEPTMPPGRPNVVGAAASVGARSRSIRPAGFYARPKRSGPTTKSTVIFRRIVKLAPSQETQRRPQRKVPTVSNSGTYDDSGDEGGGSVGDPSDSEPVSSEEASDDENVAIGNGKKQPQVTVEIAYPSRDSSLRRSARPSKRPVGELSLDAGQQNTKRRLLSRDVEVLVPTKTLTGKRMREEEPLAQGGATKRLRRTSSRLKQNLNSFDETSLDPEGQEHTNGGAHDGLVELANANASTSLRSSSSRQEKARRPTVNSSSSAPPSAEPPPHTSSSISKWSDASSVTDEDLVSDYEEQRVGTKVNGWPSGNLGKRTTLRVTAVRRGCGIPGGVNGDSHL
ncbi:hypothetical protein HDU93_002410 [Gonapodya sp. JEL0774]|nr:hypothetical protein HDU93_002410 [Gonapodya sp. JEL0774]